MDGILIIGTLDHLKIQPIDGEPFLHARSIIPWIIMVSFKRSVCVSGHEFVELQPITRKDYKELDPDPELMQRFRCIWSNIFTYVDSWEEERITSQIYRLFGQKYILREALDILHNPLVQNYIINPNYLRKRVEIDINK